jgi:hypothetical protein
LLIRSFEGNHQASQFAGCTESVTYPSKPYLGRSNSTFDFRTSRLGSLELRDCGCECILCRNLLFKRCDLRCLGFLHTAREVISALTCGEEGGDEHRLASVEHAADLLLEAPGFLHFRACTPAGIKVAFHALKRIRETPFLLQEEVTQLGGECP